MSQTERPVSLLIIEDSPDDADLLQMALRRGGVQAKTTLVTDFAAAREALADTGWDAVLSDFNLPNGDFSEILALSKEHDADTPVIVVSGAVGEEVAVELMREGASDLILKDNLSRLVPALQRELNAAEQNRARRESDGRFRDIVMVSADWIWETDADHKLSFDMSGRDDAEWADPLRRMGRTHWEALGIDPDDHPDWRDHKQMLEAHEPFRNFRFSFTSPGGHEYHIAMNGVPTFNRAGEFSGYRGTATDETLIVETYLRAQKAESALNSLTRNSA